MLKIVVGVFLGVVLSVVTLFVSYEFYVDYKTNKLVEMIKVEKQKEVYRESEQERKYKEALIDLNVNSCIYYARKKHGKNFELSRIDHKTELLVAISYISDDFKYHSRCFMNAENMTVRQFELVNKTKINAS